MGFLVLFFFFYFFSFLSFFLFSSDYGADISVKYMERQSIIWRLSCLLSFYGYALILDCLSDAYLSLSNLSPSVALKGLLRALNLF